ncbi:hypothetical protein GCM10010372_77060 [Streptomyces tauricus]|nr:hypothetical protein GCM10010372_77060 [Streptomyces tauricus]
MWRWGSDLPPRRTLTLTRLTPIVLPGLHGFGAGAGVGFVQAVEAHGIGIRTGCHPCERLPVLIPSIPARKHVVMDVQHVAGQAWNGGAGAPGTPRCRGRPSFVLTAATCSFRIAHDLSPSQFRPRRATVRTD